MMRSILAATMLTLGVGSTALAVPLGPAASPAQGGSSDLVAVKHYKNYDKYNNNAWGKNKWGGKKRHHKNAYHPGWKYQKAPKHWHSYHYRPLGWQTRGCIVVGPLWYCP